MKRTIAYILMLALLIQSFMITTVSAATELFRIDMTDRNAAVGAFAGVREGNTVEYCTDEEEPYLKIVGGSSTIGANVSKSGLPNSGKLSVNFTVRRQSGIPSVTVTAPDIILSMELNQTATYYDGATNGTAVSLKSGKWVDVTIIFDFDKQTMNFYQDGWLANENIPFRTKSTSQVTFSIAAYTGRNAKFDLKNVTVHSGEVIPEISAEMAEKLVFPERELVDYIEAPERLDKALKNAVAMTVGNSVARVNNKYVSIDPENVYVAPFINDEGNTMIPVRFVTEAAGCEVEVLSQTSFRFTKDGTVMEINMGDKNAVINGEPKEMPSAPVIKYDRLFIPLRFAVETFGNKLFWDDRGLIVISSKNAVKDGEEDIIKPLIADIRHHTTVSGNKKYSDVAFSMRYLRTDGHTVGTTTPQWGSVDASKRFMSTVNRWTYLNSGEANKVITDLGFLNQGTLNANYTNPERASSYFFDGTPYTRDDGVNGTTWACVSDPQYYEELLAVAKAGIDNGLFIWQFDDWSINYAYRLGGCFCDFCMTDFTKYLIETAPRDKVAETGLTDLEGFNYKEYLKSIGVTENGETITHKNVVLRELWESFHIYRVNNFHLKLIKEMEEYAGCDVKYSVNVNGTSLFGPGTASFFGNFTDGAMGETHGGYTSAPMVMAAKLLYEGAGLENIISPLPHTKSDKELMYGAIPMTYATGQYMLVPWDDYLSGSSRYYATLEELAHTYELPREYPFLFDNYEMPQHIGYVYDLDILTNQGDFGAEVLEKGLPARAIVSRNTGAIYEIDGTEAAGLECVIADRSIFNQLPEKEQKALLECGVPFYFSDDTENVKRFEKEYRTVWDDNKDVYTVLRENKLYDNAPVVVHAVNYNPVVQENTQISINNRYLPDGDKFTVNVYKPGKNPETIKVQRGKDETVINLESIERWTVFEICGSSTIRREVMFDIGRGYNGIGMGTRVSNDKAYGTPEDFTIVTYSEGLNSKTYGDNSGAQDEASFVYKRLGVGKVRSVTVKAGFDEENEGTYGVMVRDGIYCNAPFVALMYDEDNGLRLAQRKNANKRTDYTKLGDTRPKYMMLEREGSVYNAYISDDGKNCTLVGALTAEFTECVGGVFAASPDGSRSECRVFDFISSPGVYKQGEFSKLKISYGDGTIDRYTFGESIKMELDTEKYNDLTIEDVDVEFASSDEDVLKINKQGVLTPTGIGTATLTATAKMGLRKISSSCKIEVVPVDPVTWSESFDEGVIPSYMSSTNEATAVEDGVIKVRTNTLGAESDIYFKYDLRAMPTVYEFDFKANFGTDAPTTGARVIYANGNAVSLTCDKNGFNWFFGGNQTKVAPIEENRWYHIKIEVNYDTERVNVYIDDKLVVDNGQSRNTLAVRGSGQIGGWRMGTDTCYEWDNFKCYFVE